METVFALLVGMGLSAACGFRVFVPMLVLSIASHTGHIHLSPSFAWLSTNSAILTFAFATILEVGGYFIPFVDHLLDTIATPSAVIAGTVITASMVTEMDPFLKWTLAVIAGGGMAGLLQGSTVLTRAFSTVSTGGLANPIVAAAELGGSVVVSILSVLLPAAAAICVILLGTWAVTKYLKKRSQTKSDLSFSNPSA